MHIETNRLTIRRFLPSDEADLREYMLQRVDAEFEGYPDFTVDKSTEEITFRANSDEFYAIELKCERKVIGNVYMGKRDFNSRELGYVLNGQYQQKGYGNEACSAVISYFLAQGVHRIYAECAPCNIPSWKLLEKIGFQREGHLRQNISFHKDAQGNPIYWDTYIYGILNSDKVDDIDLLD